MKFIKTIIRRVVISAIREGQIKRFDASGIAGETITDREMFQHYGFASSPQNNAEGILIGIGNVFYLIAEDDRRYRIALQQGEVSLYTDEGDKVHLKRGKEIDVTSGGKVVVTAPEVDINANSKVILSSPNVELGNGALKKLINEALVDKFNQHTHPTAALGAPSTPTVPLVLADVATTNAKAS